MRKRQGSGDRNKRPRNFGRVLQDKKEIQERNILTDSLRQVQETVEEKDKNMKQDNLKKK